VPAWRLDASSGSLRGRPCSLSLSLSRARALSLSLSLSVLTYGIADGSREFVSTATEHTVRVLSGACGTRFSVGGLCV